MTTEENIKPELRLYDTANGNTILAYKVFDATHLCQYSKRCVIKYADCERGRIAQINDWYKKDYDLGMCVHYFINEMTAEQLMSDIVFNRFCESLGILPVNLAEAIFENQ